jgi:hypothetical protein
VTKFRSFVVRIKRWKTMTSIRKCFYKTMRLRGQQELLSSKWKNSTSWSLRRSQNTPLALRPKVIGKSYRGLDNVNRMHETLDSKLIAWAHPGSAQFDFRSRSAQMSLS